MARPTAARAVALGQPWPFTSHRTMAEVMADETTRDAARRGLSAGRIGRQDVSSLEPTAAGCGGVAAAPAGLFPDNAR